MITLSKLDGVSDMLWKAYQDRCGDLYGWSEWDLPEVVCVRVGGVSETSLRCVEGWVPTMGILAFKGSMVI